MMRRASLLLQPRACCLAVWLALGAALWPVPMLAQPQDTTPATLIADNIRFSQRAQQLEATGNVEIFHEGARLQATAISYDGATDQIEVTGPLTLTDMDGRAVILADFAQLDADLQNGILHGARLVLERELQVAATEIERSDGRFTQLYQGVASSCEVCPDNPTPLWEIRARRIVHDQEERQLYFEHATLRAMGVPVFYLPRLRLPDPSLERATGFLTPSLLVNDELGTQLRLPYFIRLGDHRDLTLTPWIGTPESRTIELRYRQAFRSGDIEVLGAASWDDLTENSPRGFLEASGRFELPSDFVLDFNLEGVSDRGYLTTYGFPDRDLLESYLRVSRATRSEYIELSATRYTGLQEGDDNETLPTRVFNAEITRRFQPAWIGGIATASLQGGGYYRLSDSDGVNGQDVTRLTGALDWRRDEVVAGGFLLGIEGGLYADIYNTRQGGALTGTESRVTPFAGVDLRYPLSRTTARGVTHLIEPIVQLAWSETSGGPVPVEDSRIVEFDEANLFSLDRFPGHDQREVGLRTNIGLAYTRTDPLGWSLGVTAGVVLREQDQGQFTPGSGLDGARSDFLVATHFIMPNRWRVLNRALFDEELDFASNELAVSWSGDDHDLLTSYTWLAADPAESRPRDMAEWAMDASYDIWRDWEANATWRYDFVEDAPTRAGLALTYQNECVDMEFSVSRRYTTSATVVPATEFGLTISLNGFGAGRQGRSHDRSCLR
jgi:LPS-assembly protein